MKKSKLVLLLVVNMLICAAIVVVITRVSSAGPDAPPPAFEVANGTGSPIVGIVRVEYDGEQKVAEDFSLEPDEVHVVSAASHDMFIAALEYSVGDEREIVEDLCTATPGEVFRYTILPNNQFRIEHHIRLKDE